MEKNVIPAYRKLNDSFSPEFVYHLGCEAGFFSEYNNMILGMLYCLRKRIRFSLYSSDANFAYLKGWTDYFIPFCEESGNILHHWLNRRPNPRFKNRLLRGADHCLSLAFRRINRNRLTLTDLWDEIRKQDLGAFEMPELGFTGDLRAACQKLIQYTWRYNSETQRVVSDHIASLRLPMRYVGFHIRGGDKFVEARLQDVDVYIQKACGLSSLREAFVLTDDYGIIELLDRTYPDWTFYTLCAPEERGYFHQKFKKQSKKIIRAQHLRLFASMDILAASDLFIGTFSSNPGMYLGMRMEEGKAYSVDMPEWRIW